jgi:putative PIN family toxin of toxin-antitoxin system
VGKKIKVVFDTNIWVSIFMEEVLYDDFSQVKKDLIVYVSEDIILELTRVLLYPKIAKILEKNGIRGKDVLRVIVEASKIAKPKVQLHIIDADEEDNKILECALAAIADVIITGDKHLLKLGKFKKTKILAPREFFDNMKGN